MAFKEILQKLRNQSELKRKIILWAIMGVIGVSIFAWWISNARHTLERSKVQNLGEELRINELQERLNEIPVKFDGEQQ